LRREINAQGQGVAGGRWICRLSYLHHRAGDRSTCPWAVKARGAVSSPSAAGRPNPALASLTAPVHTLLAASGR
jgi:hypothetical protein